MGMIASLFLLAMSILTITTTTYSRPLLNPRSQTGFKVTLNHVDSGLEDFDNLTKFDLFQRALARGNKRVQTLHSLSSSSEYSTTIESTVHPGIGEFLMELSIGTPPSPYSAILDTGSDLIWTQCKPCTRCFHQPGPIFDPATSSSFSNASCSSHICRALPPRASHCGGAGKYCEYSYAYGDNSSTGGFMATETLTFDGNVSVSKVGLGCGLNTVGEGFSQASGLVGLGRGPLSLVSQLDEPVFSYCLTSIYNSNGSSTLLMGPLASQVKNNDTWMIRTTKLIENPPSRPTFYYVSLEGIRVGEKELPIEKGTFQLNEEDGSGGMIVDSGTSITYLKESAFEVLKKEFENQMNLTVVDREKESELELCFEVPTGVHDIKGPKLVFRFEGAELELPSENYLYVYVNDESRQFACLAMARSKRMSVFGNFQQQNMHVVHDLNRETMSFVPAKCDQL